MIETQALSVRAGGFELHDVELRIPTGAYGVLMGRTGSGKTTLLEAICGLKETLRGKILLDGHDVTGLQPAQRGIGFVPQDGALFETMSVDEHLRFALRIRRRPRAEADARVQELSRLLQIQHLLPRMPAGLSGGERQRVALGRALSFHPSILCLDEPLSALDDDARLDIIELLKRVQRETGVTALHVTHSRSECEALADCWLRIEDGGVQDVTPSKA